MHMAAVYDFVLVRDQAVSERLIVLLPIEFCHIPVSQDLNELAQSNPTIPIYQPDEKYDFLSMVQVALKRWSDILAQPVHQGLNAYTEDAIACVLESLFMFLRLMRCGESFLENGLSDGDADDKEDDDDGTDNDLDSNDGVDEEGKRLIRQQNALVRKQETIVLSIVQGLWYS